MQMAREPASGGGLAPERRRGLDRLSGSSYRIYTMKERLRRTSSKARAACPSPAACCTLAISGAGQERLVRMFKALGNPLRFEILKYLVTHPGCITGNLVDVLPIAQATVSQHLEVLREAGWIQGETRGTATCYQLDAAAVAWFRDRIQEIF